MFEMVVGDADTLAGMLLEIKGEFPALHEKVTYHNYEFEVLEMDSRRILKVKFTILRKEMEDGVVSAVLDEWHTVGCLEDGRVFGCFIASFARCAKSFL